MTRATRSQFARDGTSRSGENSERLLWGAIARSHGDAVVCIDLESIVISWNEGASRMFGYSAEEMIGTTFWRVIPEDAHAREMEMLRGLAAGSANLYESKRIPRHSQPLRVITAVSAIEDETGIVIGALRIEREIPERASGDEFQARLAAIVESSEDAIVSKNLDGIVTSWNQASARLFGYTAEEMIGQSILRLIPADLHTEEAEILRKVRAGERIHHYETRRISKDGGSIDVSLTISPIRISRDTSPGRPRLRAISRNERRWNAS